MKTRKSKKTSRPTALDHAKCMWNNTQALLDQAEAQLIVLKDDHEQAVARINELERRGTSAVSTFASLRDNIATLKTLVADLERAVANRDGIITTLERQIDQAAPKVMVTPPQMVSPAEAEARRAGGRPMSDYQSLRDGAVTARSTAKHWTAL